MVKCKSESKATPQPRKMTVPKMWLKEMPVKELLTWDKNPRINDPAVDKLAGLIQAHGYRVPIIASHPDMVIRAGHTRLKALLKMGITKVPVLFQGFKSKEEAEAFAIADNRSNEWSNWDLDKLEDLLKELDTAGFDFNFTGFTKEEMKSLFPDISPEGIDDKMLEGIQGEVEAQGDFIAINFDTVEECAKVKKQLGLNKGTKVISYKDFCKVAKKIF